MISFDINDCQKNSNENPTLLDIFYVRLLEMASNEGVSFTGKGINHTLL